MELRLSLVLLLLALALVAESSPLSGDAYWVVGGVGASRTTCSGLVGDCIGGDANEMMMSSSSFDDIIRRELYYRRRHISYAALSKNRVPCNRKGASYYNCRGSSKVNPYRRSCTMATHCARDLS